MLNFQFGMNIFLCHVESDNEIPVAQVFKAVDLHYANYEMLSLRSC